MEQQPLTYPYPPNEIFAKRSARDTILNEGGVTHLLDVSKPHPIEYPESGGILIHIVGAKYPKKGFPFPEAIWAINLAKKFFVSTLKILTIPSMRGWMFIFFLPHKKKLQAFETILWSFNRLAHGAVDPFLMKESFMTPCAQEVKKLTTNFLKELGIAEFTAQWTSEITSCIIEYDDAYRYRLEDIMCETTKEALIKNPRRELRRLLSILIKREPGSTDVSSKAKVIHKLIGIIFLSRRIRNAFRRAIEQTDITKLQADAADKYWMSMRADYDYGGVPFKDRKVELLQAYKISV